MAGRWRRLPGRMGTKMQETGGGGRVASPRPRYYTSQLRRKLAHQRFCDTGQVHGWREGGEERRGKMSWAGRGGKGGMQLHRSCLPSTLHPAGPHTHIQVLLSVRLFTSWSIDQSMNPLT
eukprot:364633-Chlamydomonas_euryale.AAC.6